MDIQCILRGVFGWIFDIPVSSDFLLAKLIHVVAAE